MRYLPTCDNQPGCDGHLGKFESCRDEMLWTWGLDSYEGFGDSDWDGYYSLVILTETDTATDESVANGEPVTIPAGNYIVHTASSGAVSVWTYATEEAARERYDRAEIAYYAWDSDDDAANL